MDDHFYYIERPMAILDKKMKTLKNKAVKLVKVHDNTARVQSGRGSQRMR